MFRWSDVVATLGIVALAILGGYLKALPDKLVTALVMAAVGYYAARTALARRDSKDASEAKDAKDERKEQRSERAEERSREDGVPEQQHSGIEESGRIHVQPQQSGRVVEVNADGSVTIGPDSQPQPVDRHEPEPFSQQDSDKTPQEAPRATGTDDSEPGD